jgi:hypothetical protein
MMFTSRQVVALRACLCTVRAYVFTALIHVMPYCFLRILSET